MITVPESFRRMPRWWSDTAGREWLESLPERVEVRCRRWGLRVDGSVMHGSNALVVPVRRGEERFVLRLAPPGDDVAAEAAALRMWDGRGTVRLYDADEVDRAMLLERLDGERTLADEPLDDAVTVLAELVTALAIPVPPTVRGTDQIAAEHAETFERDWTALNAPFPRRQLDEAIQVRAASEPLYSRRRQRSMATFTSNRCWRAHGRHGSSSTRCCCAVIPSTTWDASCGAGWMRFRTTPESVDCSTSSSASRTFPPTGHANGWSSAARPTSLWGLRHGLTEDPPRCRRLLDVFA